MLIVFTKISLVLIAVPDKQARRTVRPAIELNSAGDLAAVGWRLCLRAD